MSNPSLENSALQRHRAYRKRKQREERALRLQQDRVQRSRDRIEKLKPLTHAMRLALGPRPPSPRKLKVHYTKVSHQLADTLAALGEAELLDKLDHLDDDATIAHYHRQGDDPGEAPILLACAKQMIRVDPANAQQLAKLVRESVEEPGLIKIWDWVYILLDGLAGQQRLVWKGSSGEATPPTGQERPPEKSQTIHRDGPEAPHWLRWNNERIRIGKGRARLSWLLLNYFWERDSSAYEDLQGPGKPWPDPVSDSAIATAVNRFNLAIPSDFQWMLATKNRYVYRQSRQNPAK
jgi:hypothetical protein